MEEEPPVITAIDYLHQLNQLEQEAKDTYPARIDSCSFRLGYRTQPVYSCLSENCREKASPAGFCYACSVSCHTDHKVIELFTKRHFRCDCGTKNSPNTPCCLITAPDDERKQTTGSVVNEENEYNHNFDGRYCWCDREYDPYSEEGTMFQCVLCHDWRHENCIGLIPPESSFVDYVCRTCVSDTKLLKRYRGIHFIAGISKPDGVVERLEGYDGKQTRACEESVDIREAAVKNTEISETHRNRNSITKDDITVQKTDIPEAQVEKTERSETHSMRNSVGEETSSSKENSATPKRLRTLPRGFSPRNSPKYRLGCPATPTTGGSIKRLAVDDIRDTERSTPTKRSRVSTSEYGGCCLADMPEVGTNENVDLFCRDGWREALCQCSRCMSEYKSTIKLLTEHAEEYEPEVDEDDDEDPSIFERGMKALQAMPRSTQVDGVMAYNKMRDEIKGFLRGFAMSGEIVKKEDVKKFFDERQEKMRERRV